VSIVFYFLECNISGITEKVAFPDLYILLNNIHLKFFHVFCGLIAHFFLAQNNIPLSEFTTGTFSQMKYLDIKQRKYVQDPNQQSYITMQCSWIE
jgi:hypothetical protein